MILIYTSKVDTHADAAIRLLSSQSIEVFRLNTEDILSYGVDVEISSGGKVKFSLDNRAGRVLDCDELTAVWYRKPDFLFRSSGAVGLLGAAEKLVFSESRNLLESLYKLEQIFWVNDPIISQGAKIKIPQLQLAGRLGFMVPKTVVTNCPETAVKFAAASGGKVVCKSIYTANVDVDGLSRGLVTRLLTAQSVEDFAENIRMCPVLLQEFVPKAYEIRVTVVGNELFAIKIFSQDSSETQVDWRINPDACRHELTVLPEKVHMACLRFVAGQGLIYGAIDLIVTPEGDYVFLENNPYGQYLWCELETGAPITQSICSLLLTGGKDQTSGMFA